MATPRADIPSDWADTTVLAAESLTECTLTSSIVRSGPWGTVAPTLRIARPAPAPIVGANAGR